MKSTKNLRWTPKSGITILEVLIVLSIIALIAAVAGPRLIGYLGRAKTETAELQATQLRQAVQLFYIDVGRYPSDSEGLRVLTTAPPGETSWAGPYLEAPSALIDPWGRDYIYIAPEVGRDFSIISLGLDGQPGGTGENADVGR
ncbi:MULTISPECIES: type II secretion system major pseudopilin GspG [unclassified Yoonia]|uniref:type II secretion system major pseudopilin GspG n=1 Tax=unclassified Yoonia TaxID=2629118 RepID=UPI002AFE2B6C|nr:MULTISPECIES: type II secretion system major pseudopilin GspG [unclassified Yoonia]